MGGATELLRLCRLEAVPSSPLGKLLGVLRMLACASLFLVGLVVPTLLTPLRLLHTPLAWAGVPKEYHPYHVFFSLGLSQVK